MKLCNKLVSSFSRLGANANPFAEQLFRLVDVLNPKPRQESTAADRRRRLTPRVVFFAAQRGVSEGLGGIIG